MDKILYCKMFPFFVANTRYRSFLTTMLNLFTPQGHQHRNNHEVTNLYHYRAKLFYIVIDKQLQEQNNRFSEIST